MAKDKTAALERAKKATAKAKGKKTSQGGSSSRSGLPLGWIHGDWIRSTIQQEDLEDLVEGGLIPHDSWRLPGDETEQRPQEEVDEETVAQWLQGITGNKDNPRRSRRIPPLDNTNEPDKIYTEMYSMPNGEREQEGEGSGGDSSDWHSDGGGDEESEDSSSGEEVDSPPRSERRSKQRQDPASVRGKVTPPTGQTSKRTQTSSPVPTKKALKQPKVASSKPRKALPKIKVAVPIASGVATSGTSIYKDDDEEEMEDAVTSNAALPNVIELPNDDEDVPQRPTRRRGGTSGRKAPAIKTPQSTPAAEPRSCELGAQFADLEQKQIQLNLDLELAKENLQKAKDDAAEKMSQALEKKDLELAAAQKSAEEKAALADQKLASVGNQRRDELETYLGRLAKKLFLMLEDEAAMNVLRLESRLARITDYLAQLKVAVSWIDTALWPRETLQNDLESLMTRLNEIPGRVQEWKKSSARCGTDVALSLVRVHCKEAKEEKLAGIKVANT
nr:nucleolar and coiled-body phosphoprotein 1-like [Aegilops tauschii subsp. strangulata]